MITLDNQDIDCGDRHASLGGYVLDRSSIKEQVRQLSKINNLKAAWTIVQPGGKECVFLHSIAIFI
ncbi:hypothetical protein WA1_47190 [Scytonema hofmannii PCC 7110]|uniref:Uncharacterized protein n=1 Tax=Scytonema hofmannii PCC 7110 TaxID=128403 RepID=A0A139WXP5_9CYAN|nr:hypothetical protein [Scytonema hofmannii]KYC37215.1 hypothetical protein WA1_47190 [Scytonema hofmannii PCC 7110]